MLTYSFEDLVQAFRVMAESHLKLNQLITVDRPEAVGNIETAINAKLNAFHNLYDLMGRDLGRPVDWYGVPELCTLLAIRNARHHNKANRIRSIYNYHTQYSDLPTDTRKYLYVDFPSADKEDGGQFFNVELSWGDIEQFLSLPRAESRLNDGARELVRSYVNADQFEAEALKLGFKVQDVFINFIPLTLNAGIVLHPFIKDHVQLASTESKTFLHIFEAMDKAVTTQPELNVIEFSLPQ